MIETITGSSLDEFRAHVLQNVLKAKPVNPDAGLVGMSEKDSNQNSRECTK